MGRDKLRRAFGREGGNRRLNAVRGEMVADELGVKWEESSTC
jgi:hypothetical protein